MTVNFVANLESGDRFEANINAGSPATKHLGPSAHVYLGSSSLWTYDPAALLALAETLTKAALDLQKARDVAAVLDSVARCSSLPVRDVTSVCDHMGAMPPCRCNDPLCTSGNRCGRCPGCGAKWSDLFPTPRDIAKETP